jgi:hypothetical protein
MYQLILLGPFAFGVAAKGVDVSSCGGFGCNGVALVVSGKSTSLSGNSFEYVIDEVVHNDHGLSTDTSIWMNLLQDFVDVNSESFVSTSLSHFLVTSFFLGS